MRGGPSSSSASMGGRHDGAVDGEQRLVVRGRWPASRRRGRGRRRARAAGLAVGEAMSAARANTGRRKCAQGGGDAGERRRARPGVVHDLDAGPSRPQVERSDPRPTRPPPREEGAQKGEVAQQERAALEDEEALVDAGAAAAAAGEERADPHLGMRVERHGEWRQAIRRAASAAARTRPSGRSYRPCRKGSGRLCAGEKPRTSAAAATSSARRTAVVRAVTAARRSMRGRRQTGPPRRRAVSSVWRSGAFHRGQEVEGDPDREAEAFGADALEQTRRFARGDTGRQTAHGQCDGDRPQRHLYAGREPGERDRQRAQAGRRLAHPEGHGDDDHGDEDPQVRGGSERERRPCRRAARDTRRAPPPAGSASREGALPPPSTPRSSTGSRACPVAQPSGVPAGACARRRRVSWRLSPMATPPEHRPTATWASATTTTIATTIMVLRPRRSAALSAVRV